MSRSLQPWLRPGHARQGSLRACLGAGWALLAAFACAPPAPPPPTQPLRAVLISIDTLRADHVGAYGAGPDRTPVLDALAMTGVRFENAISPAPLTLPSHATLLTGLDPPDHGVHHNTLFRLGEDVPTLATHLHQQGFATAAFVGAFVLNARFGLARGFDVYDDELPLSAPTQVASAIAEKDAPKNGISYAVLGRVKEFEGEELGAAAGYERALALEAPSAAPLTGLGRVAENAGGREESRTY